MKRGLARTVLASGVVGLLGPDASVKDLNNNRYAWVDPDWTNIPANFDVGQPIPIDR